MTDSYRRRRHQAAVTRKSEFGWLSPSRPDADALSLAKLCKVLAVSGITVLDGG
jgi:hypothetical protein